MKGTRKEGERSLSVPLDNGEDYISSISSIAGILYSLDF